jgi:hypothetical protein
MTARLPLHHSTGPVGDEARRPFEPVMERLRAEALIHFGTAEVRLAPVAVEHRRFSSLLRLAVCRPGEPEPRLHLFLKLCGIPPGHTIETIRARVLSDFETTSRIHTALAAWPDVGGVRAVACYPEQLAIVTEETPGETLGAYLDARVRWFPSPATLDDAVAIAATVGRWVARFQALDPRPGRISLGDLREYIDIRLTRLVQQPAARFTGGDRVRVLRLFDDLAVTVTDEELAESIVHADLAPGNVLVSGGRVVVLDFAMSKRGSVWLDLSRLHLQLDLLRAKPQFRRPVIQKLQQALLHGYAPDLTADRPLFRLLLLRHHVNHLSMLSSSPGAFPASLYSARIRRWHRRWIERETGIARAPATSGAPA